MSDNIAAVVREVLDDTDELIIRYNNRVSAVVDNLIPHDVSTGDVVIVDKDYQEATDLKIKGGYTHRQRY